MTDKEKIRAEIERLIKRAEAERVLHPKTILAAKNYLLIEDYKKLISFIDSLPEEPVSEDLEAEVMEYSNTHNDECFDAIGDKCQFVINAFKAGAQWQKEQFEKNRLKHCNSITKEQAELEQGFVDQHIDKYNRMPTFLDAIEYGMNLQKEQMMKDAIESEAVLTSNGTLFPSIEPQQYEYCDKVKVIII